MVCGKKLLKEIDKLLSNDQHMELSGACFCAGKDELGRRIVFKDDGFFSNQLYPISFSVLQKKVQRQTEIIVQSKYSGEVLDVEVFFTVQNVEDHF